MLRNTNTLSKSTLISICLLTAPCFAAAQPFYLSVGLGYGVTALNRPTIATSFKRDGLAWTLFAGYKVCRFFALEGGYMRMNNVKSTGMFQGQSIEDTITPFYGYASAKALFPLPKHVELFFKLGAAYVEGKDTLIVDGSTTRQSQEKIVPYIAGGLSYFLTTRLSISATVSNTFKYKTIPRLTTGTLDVSYYFGSTHHS